MKLILFFLAFIPVVAMADPSIGASAGADVQNGESQSLKRDKSMSVDKSSGHRKSHSDSDERSRERSKSLSHSERQSSSRDNQQSFNVDVNINSILLREFSNRYERNQVGQGMAGEYFKTCKPLMNALIDYPVVDYNNYRVMGRSQSMYNDGQTNLTRADGTLTPDTDPHDLYISRYSQCRMTASFWLEEAGKKASENPVKSEIEIALRIQQVFAEMDASDDLFQTIRQRARDLWAQANCSRWLDDWRHFTQPSIECGVFSYTSAGFVVSNRPTLSESAIGGNSYKIALSASESRSTSVEDSRNREARLAESERDTNNKERYSEGRKSASMSRSHSTESSSSDSVSQGSNADMTATPHK